MYYSHLAPSLIIYITMRQCSEARKYIIRPKNLNVSEAWQPSHDRQRHHGESAARQVCGWGHFCKVNFNTHELLKRHWKSKECKWSCALLCRQNKTPTQLPTPPPHLCHTVLVRLYHGLLCKVFIIVMVVTVQQNNSPQASICRAKSQRYLKKVSNPIKCK